MKKTVLAMLLFALPALGGYGQNTMKVATYNIRLAHGGDSLEGNGWQARRGALTDLLAYNGFDVFGTQEGFVFQLKDMLAALPGYAYIGVGRDDGAQRGEYAAIFYRIDRVEVLRSGNFWLSTVTDRPNTGWDAALPRICSWGQMLDRATGLKFWFFNLHMDHIGVEARRESARLILSKIKEMCGDEPVILTGDFNVDQRNESYRLLQTSGVLTDCYQAAGVRYATNGTFNGFNPDSWTDKRIDHIFVSPHFKVDCYAVLTDTYRSHETPKEAPQADMSIDDEVLRKTFRARLPSDHFPVVAELSW